MWRPDDWENPIESVKVFRSLTFLNPGEAFESGADAMVGALIDWGMEQCEDRTHRACGDINLTCMRADCPECRRELLEENYEPRR